MLNTVDASWDRITLAGLAFSGLAQVDKAERSRKVDKPSAPGADGVRLRIKGREVAEPEITLVGWTDEHLAEMRRIADAVHPIGRGERHNAIAAEHPRLAFHGITKLFVVKVTGPEVGDDRRVTLTLETIEWRPPPAGARSATRSPTAPARPAPVAFTGLDAAPVASYAATPAPRASASTPAAAVPASFSAPPSASVAPLGGTSGRLASGV